MAAWNGFDGDSKSPKPACSTTWSMNLRLSVKCERYDQNHYVSCLSCTGCPGRLYGQGVVSREADTGLFIINGGRNSYDPVEILAKKLRKLNETNILVIK